MDREIFVGRLMFALIVASIMILAIWSD